MIWSTRFRGNLGAPHEVHLAGEGTAGLAQGHLAEGGHAPSLLKSAHGPLLLPSHAPQASGVQVPLKLGRATTELHFEHAPFSASVKLAFRINLDFSLTESRRAEP